MFQAIVSGLSFLLISVTVAGLLNWIRRKPEKAMPGTVRLPRFLLLIGVIVTTFFLALIIIVVSTKQLIALVILLSLACLGAILIIAALNYSIQYDEESFTYRNFWGIRRKFFYSDLTGISGITRDIKLFAGKHVIRIDELAIGDKEFLGMAQKKYRITHDGRPIPKMKWGRFDIFNGNVENPGEFIFLYCLFFAIIIGMMIFIAIQSQPISYADLDYRETTFSGYTIDDDHLKLNAPKSKLSFDINPYHDLTRNIDTLKYYCDGNTTFMVYFQKCTPEAQAPYYDIISLRDQRGNVYVTLKQSNAYIKKSGLQAEALFGVFLLFWIILVTGSVVVGRHPEKYNRRFIRLFFQDSYVHNEGRLEKHNHP